MGRSCFAGCALLAALALVLGGCGGDEAGDADPGPDLGQASAPCAEAFAAAVDQAEPVVTHTDRAGPNAKEASAALIHLRPTLDACADRGDWIAGALAHREALPQLLPADAALRDLCGTLADGARDDTAPCAGEALTPPG